MKFFSLIKLRLYDSERKGFIVWGEYLTAKEAKDILALGIEFATKDGPEYLSKAEASGDREWFQFKTASGDKYHALLSVISAVENKVSEAYYPVRHAYYNFLEKRRFAKPQNLPLLRIMRLKADDPSNAPEYLPKSMTFDDHYILLGEVEQAPGHVIVFNMTRGVMVTGILHPERFEPVPRDET